MQELVRGGFVYPCNCSRKDLQQAMHAPHEDTDDEPVYSGRCRPSEHGAGATQHLQPESAKSVARLVGF